VIYPVVGNCSGGANAVGQISSYVVSNGTLSPGSGSPFRAGVAPVAIATDPTSRFTYVVDYRQNQILAYSIQPGGLLEPLVNSNQPTGQLPSSITIDPRGKFIYVTNYGGGSVNGYAMNAVTGVPSALAGSGSAATDVGPAAVIIEDSIGRYIYTANFVGNSTSGLYLDPNAGTTSQVQNSPFPGASKPTAVSSVKHGDHAIQVNPSY
jgi:6-phosphogluconolactonase